MFFSGSRSVRHLQTRSGRTVLRGAVSDVQVRQRERHLFALSPELHWIGRLHGSAGHGGSRSMQLVCTGALRQCERHADDALLTSGHRVQSRLLPWNCSCSLSRSRRRKTGKCHSSIHYPVSPVSSSVNGCLSGKQWFDDSLKTTWRALLKLAKIITTLLTHCNYLYDNSYVTMVWCQPTIQHK